MLITNAKDDMVTEKSIPLNLLKKDKELVEY